MSGPYPTGPAQKRTNGAPGVLEDEAIEEQVALLPESLEDDGDDVDQQMLEDDLELHLGEAGRNWERPAPPPLEPSTQSLGMLLHMHAIPMTDALWCNVPLILAHQKLPLLCIP